MEDGSFYIVWNPESTNPPRKRHYSFDLAKSEAERLSRQHEGAELFVLEAVSVSRTRTTVTTELRAPLMPF